MSVSAMAMLYSADNVLFNNEAIFAGKSTL